MKKLLVLFALTTCTALAHAANSPPNTAYSGQYTGISDQTLSGQIQNTLSAYQYQGKYDHVQVSVNGGNAVLTGTVPAQGDRDALGALVGGINGIRSVDNKVTIKSDTPDSHTNAPQLNDKPYQGASSYSGSCPYAPGNH